MLPNLVFVFPDNNVLTGRIPEWTAVLMQRQELTVAYNLLTGEIPGAPEGGLAALGSVTLESFRLSKVDISNNRLRGTIPAEIAFIPFFWYIDFSNNPQLRGAFPSFPGVSLCQSLYRILGCLELPTDRISSLQLCTNPHTLHLSWKSFDGRVPA